MKNNKIRRCLISICILLVSVVLNNNAYAGAKKTKYPVIFAHGIAVQQHTLGTTYFGDEWGNEAYDPCGFLEISCNSWIHSGQVAKAWDVSPWGVTYDRPMQLANKIESFMATKGYQHVNIVGHSGGGTDLRAAAWILRMRKGYQVVKMGVSISSPHRGNAWCKYLLDNYPSASGLLQVVSNYFGPFVYSTPVGDIRKDLTDCQYNDAYSGDGVDTALSSWNNIFSLTQDVAAPRSIVSVQQGLSLDPVLMLANLGLFNHDGDGYCQGDCNNDGEAGKGDGNRYDTDDDGVVALNSQQIGYRIKYQSYLFSMNKFKTDYSAGFVSNVNNPPSSAMKRHSAVLDADHLDVAGILPDTFDELQFYSAIIDYIARSGY